MSRTCYDLTWDWEVKLWRCLAWGTLVYCIDILAATWRNFYTTFVMVDLFFFSACSFSCMIFCVTYVLLVSSSIFISHVHDNYIYLSWNLNLLFFSQFLFLFRFDPLSPCRPFPFDKSTFGKYKENCRWK